jgi:molecular chaperone GrpE (heat shock protein)
MNDRHLPIHAKWPFYVADLLLLGLAVWMFKHYPHPLAIWPAVLLTGCVAGAAVLGILPYHLEYQTAVRFAESEGLTSAVGEIQKLHAIAEQIRLATGQWQSVQEHSAKTVSAAKEIGERMGIEAKAFGEFMRKANDSEKAALQLEVEKLRRGEHQWLQILVHMLDHVFALYQAGARSGQPNLEAQLGNFQEACRNLVRRVGLTPFEAMADEVFDPEKHELPEGQPEPPAEARISQTLTSGYTFQGQLLRRSVVALQESLMTTELPQAVLGEAPPVEIEEPEVEILQAESASSEAPGDAEPPRSSELEFRLEAESLAAQARQTRQS